MSRTWKILFSLSGLLGLLASIPSPVLLPYPLFVFAYLRGWRLPEFGTPAVRLLLSTLISTSILEIGAWLGSYQQNETAPALFHPQLIPDWILSLGFYAAWWLTWWLILRRYRFTAFQVFLTTGLYGVLIEQQGSIFLAGLTTFPLGMVLWLFVFVAYGATMALAFYLVRDSFTGIRDSWLKVPLAWVGLLILTFVTFFVWGSILEVLNIIPPAKFPMWKYPFW